MPNETNISIRASALRKRREVMSPFVIEKDEFDLSEVNMIDQLAEELMKLVPLMPVESRGRLERVIAELQELAPLMMEEEGDEDEPEVQVLTEEEL